MIQEKLDRINELARLAKLRELSAEELEERKVLRMEYIAEWRRGTLEVLESIYILDENGKEVKLPRKKKK
ncbi:MAG: DUF896 domain-containing protein [Oscillospiraceae bacterium]|nr:DUF896 domain-containing protein [bacterium]MDY5101107.1 DUF896 domain-containing protein [Oscillospiraceae bacterium]